MVRILQYTSHRIEAQKNALAVSDFAAEEMNIKTVTRGYFDFASNGHLCDTRWKNSKVVNLISDKYIHLPVGSTTHYLKRSAKAETLNVDIALPHNFSMYNSGMVEFISTTSYWDPIDHHHLHLK